MCKLKRQIIHIAMGVSMGLAMGACDILDVDPTSVITADSFWKTESDAEGGFAGMYVFLRDNTTDNMFIWARDAKRNAGIGGYRGG